MMADIETLRREFEAALQSGLIQWGGTIDLTWIDRPQHSSRVSRYFSEGTQSLFSGFCAGRKASQAEVERLRSIVDRIPKFADGSPALPGDEAWHPGLGVVGKVCYHHPDVRMIGPGYVQFESGARSRRQSICECYPTREAMEAREKP